MSKYRYEHIGDQPYDIPDAGIEHVAPGDKFDSPVPIRHPSFREIDEHDQPVPKADTAAAKLEAEAEASLRPEEPQPIVTETAEEG